ncbi:MAG TPA: porin family protein [Chryseosolibacter sp.]|nr:porin family protein [Chryseosolibacter sp.]
MAASLRIVGVIGFIFIMCSRVNGQDENCEGMLVRATEEFQAGHFSSIPGILSECLDKFTQEQQLRANLLLTQTYLLLDDPLGAKRSYMEVLRANPEFVADPNVHPIDVVYLSKKFTSSPVFAWYGKAGANVSPIWVIRDNDAFGDESVTEKYQWKLGYQIGVGGDMYVYERFDLRGELNYTFARYEHNTTTFFEGDKKTVTDNQSWIGFPLMVVYHPKTGKFQPYWYGGYSLSYLVRDIVNIGIENIQTAEVGRDEKQSPEMNYIQKRNRWNQSVVLGSGVKMKFGLDFLFVDFRYNIGLKNIVDPKHVYTDNSLPPTTPGFVGSGRGVFSYAHVDDFFRIDNVSISFGFLRPLYKPRELKRSRTRSLSKKINASQE